MFIIESLSLRLCTFLFFLQHPQLSSTVIFYSLCSGVVVFAIHYTVAETINNWPGYIRQFYLWSWGKAEQGESIIGKKTKEERASPAHASPPSCALRLACQRSRINPCRGTQPRSLATITCDNRRMILSLAGRPPQRCAITADCHNLVPSHGKSFDLKCTAVKFKKRSCQVLTRSGWVVWSFVWALGH